MGLDRADEHRSSIESSFEFLRPFLRGVTRSVGQDLFWPFGNQESCHGARSCVGGDAGGDRESFDGIGERG